jgi:hypothetical protein
MKHLMKIMILLLLLAGSDLYAQDMDSTQNELNMLNKPKSYRFTSAHIVLSYLNWTNLPEKIQYKSASNWPVSIYYVFNFLKNKKHFNFGAGLSFDFLPLHVNTREWDFDSTGKVENVYADSLYNKNKWNFTYIGVPIEIKFKLGKEEKKTVNMGIGFKVSTLLASRNRMRLENRIQIVKTKYNLNQHFSYSIFAHIGYKMFSIFGTYNLSPLFDAKNAPDTGYWSVGLALML